jgi:hypothetical protein
MSFIVLFCLLFGCKCVLYYCHRVSNPIAVFKMSYKSKSAFSCLKISDRLWGTPSFLSNEYPHPHPLPTPRHLVSRIRICGLPSHLTHTPAWSSQEITPMYLRWDTFHFTASRCLEHGNRLRHYTNHSRLTRQSVLNVTYLHGTCDITNILIPAVRWLRYCLCVPVARLNIDPKRADQLSSANAACHHAASPFHHARQVEDGTLVIA